MTDLEPLLDAKKVKKILDVSLPYVYRLAERGQLRCIRWECPGQGAKRSRETVRFRRADVMEFIDKHTTGRQ